MPGLPTTVAGSTCPDVCDRDGLLGWRFAEAGDMPFLVAVATVHLSTMAGVVKAALVTFEESLGILPQGSWSDGGSGSTNRHYLLFLDGILGRTVLLVVP